MLYCFLLYEVNQPHVYKYHLLLGFPTHLGHLRALSRVLCAVQQVLTGIWFIHSPVCMCVK